MHIPPELWDNIATGLGVGASAAAVLAALWATLKLARQAWARSAGRRRAQSKLLNKLACGSSREYVESLLGVPQFSTTEGQVERDIYSLTGAWVQVEFCDGEVIAFSITIRDRNMWHSTKRLMYGNANLKIGKDNFGNPILSPEFNGERSLHLWYGARTRGAAEWLSFGNPGQYQDYWLSHNMAGAGRMEVDLKSTDYRSGQYLREENLNEWELHPGSASNCPELSGVTINTLTILGPYPKAGLDRADFMKRITLGPDHDRLRLAGYWIPGRLEEIAGKLASLKWRVTNKMRSIRKDRDADSR